VIEILKLASVIIIIIFLIKKKWKLGYIMFLSSLFLGIIFGLNPIEIGQSILYGLTDFSTLKLIGVIFSVYALSGILKRIRSFENLVESLQQIVRDYRLVLAFIPALLGFIPMPAGAIFQLL